MINNKYFFKMVLALIFTTLIMVSCTEDNTLAPYVGSPGMSKIIIETGSTTPKITWVGGYVTVLGVNQGNHPALDSTLIWLIYLPGNQIKFPVKYGQLPAGSQDITTSYGGEFLPELVEDSSYSIWVMKEADWNQISSEQNKYLNLDSTLTSIVAVGDTINLPPKNYTQLVTPLDNYINIKNVVRRGWLADIYIEQPSTDNNPKVWWDIIQAGVTDTLISVIGICVGSSFDPGSIVWEVYSVHDSAGVTYYGKKNVIPGPLKMGDHFPETFVFTEYPEGGLLRDQSYFLYIANKDWDGEKHDRTARYFCLMTFETY